MIAWKKSVSLLGLLAVTSPALLHRGWTVSWLGTRAGMENRLVPSQGIVLDAIGFSGLRGKGLMHTLTGGVRLLKAFWDCIGILRRRVGVRLRK